MFKFVAMPARDTVEIKRFNEHTIVWIKSGFGNYEVDFKEYLFTEEDSE